MIHGIYAGDHKKLSVKSTLKILWEYEQTYGSITRGIFANQTPPTEFGSCSDSQKFINELKEKSIFSFLNGMQVLVNGLESDLKKMPNVTILKSTKCLKIDTNKTTKQSTATFQNSTLQITTTKTFDHIISTIPSKKLSQLLDPTLPSVQFLSKIPAVTVAVVNIVLKGKNALNIKGFGYLVPSTSPTDPTLGMIFDSFAIPDQDDIEDVTRVTVMLGGHKFDTLLSGKSEDEIIQIAVDGLERVGGDETMVLMKRCRVLRDCIPQYVVGHDEGARRVCVEGVTVLGASLFGVSVNDCIFNAKKCVDRFII